MRKNIIFVLVIVCLFIVAGCAANTNSQQNSNSKNQQSTTGRGGFDFASSTDRFLANSVTSTSADLLLGKQVMIMGTANADGTISASQIILGEFSTSSSQTSRPQRGNFTGQRPGGGQNGASGQSRARVAGMTRVNGKIIKKDDTSLVLESAEGGSKIVFYSDKTKIFTIKSP